MAEGTSNRSTRTSLDGHGVFAIIVFAFVALICIQPIHIPVPHWLARKARALKAKLVGPSKDADSGSTSKGQGAAGTASSSQQQTSIEALQANGLPAEGLVQNDPRQERAYVVLNHVWTPAIGILFLLATTTIGGEQIKVGIVGEEGVEPYDVLVFFISLAYIAISLDATGLLRYLAFQVCLKAGKSGMGLYLILYAFFWTLGVLVGNDPVILSGTAFLVYLTRVAGITPPSAWIMAQFVAANVSSAVLVSSNPTNLVIASGFNIRFTTYTAYMVLPALVSALFALAALLLFFRNKTAPPQGTNNPAKRTLAKVEGWTESIGKGKSPHGNGVAPLRRRASERPHENADANTGAESIEMAALGNHERPADPEPDEEHEFHPTIYIPKTIVRPDVDPRAALVDPKGAIFCSVVMAATLITVIVTNVAGVHAKVYMIAAPGAAVCLVRDIVYDAYTWRSFRKQEHAERSEDSVETAKQQTGGHGIERVNSAYKEGIDQEAETVEELPTENGTPATARKPILWPVVEGFNKLNEMFPTVSYVMSRLPFPLLPFAFGMFILVQSLEHVGFINIMAGGLGDVCAHGYIGCSFFISVLAVILCNLGGTNIGSTILLTRALQSSFFQQKLPVDEAALILHAASLSIAFGSNVGALGGTFAASLAGLLWRDGLRQRGVLVTKGQFALWCAVVIVPATASGVLILLPQVRYFNLL